MNRFTPRARRLTAREEQLVKKRRRVRDAIAKASRKANRER